MTEPSAPNRGNLATVTTLTTPASTGASSCTDEMTCECELCTAERAWRVKRGVKNPPRIPHRIAA